MSSVKNYDLIVVGSGPGGYVAAIRAAQLGLRVAVVEKDPAFGGTCLHRGCIPTKALLHTAATLDAARQASQFGVELGEPQLDLPKAQAYKSRVVDKNARGIELLFKKNKIDGLHGFGRLVGAHEVEVEGTDSTMLYQAKNVLIATGSVPRALPFAPVDGERIVNSDQILAFDRVPESLAVLGAGAVGTEFASVFNSFGSQVTLIEMLPQVLPIEDQEISAELERALGKRGIDCRTNTRLARILPTENGLELTLDKEGEEAKLEVATLLVAAGRAPLSSSIGLAAAGVKVDERGYIGINAQMQTSVPGIYAIGDVVDTPWLAHVASHEGILAAEHMAGEKVRPIDYDRVPSCTYCHPEVASVGLTETEAERRGHQVAVGKFPFSALGKAGILGHPEGFVKIVRDTRYDELLGVHILGAHATDLIAEACVALQVESTTEELFRTMHAHPTLSEGVMEAAHAAFGHSIHS